VTVGEIIAQVRSQGGIDASSDVVRGWVLDRIDRLVSRSHYKRAVRAVGTTVAGESEYALEEEIVDLAKLKVDGVPYTLASIEELWDLKNGVAYQRGRGGGGFFAPSYSSSGSDAAEGFELFPEPDTDGLDIRALVSLRPDVTPDGEEPPIPREFHHYIRAGAIADGLALMDERIGEAGAFEEVFEQGVVELSKRRKSRIGSGPQQIPIRY
jgi:hypothetical protein